MIIFALPPVAAAVPVAVAVGVPLVLIAAVVVALVGHVLLFVVVAALAVSSGNPSAESHRNGKYSAHMGKRPGNW